MAFLESPVFPLCARFGAVSVPVYRTFIAASQSGREQRNRVWKYPLYRFVISVQRDDDDVYHLLHFFHAVGGTECGFRFRDPSGFKTCTPGLEPSPVDAPIVASEDSPPSYHLAMRYAAGAREQLRPIYKPVAGTVRVANELGVEQAASTWTLDEETGQLEPGVGFAGVPTTWGGEFDVPVRFESDELPIVLQDRAIQSADFTLVELRDPD